MDGSLVNTELDPPSNSARSNLCAECRKDGGNDCFECGLCAKWLHFECVNVLKKNVRAIAENEHILVICQDCTKFAQKRRTAISSIVPVPSIDEDRMAAVESQLATVVSTLQKMCPPDNATDDNVSTAVPARSFAQVASQNAGPGGPVIYTRPSGEDESQHNRCIVVRGLPENGNDFEEISSMVKILDPSAAVQQVFRMGLYAPRRQHDPQTATTPPPRLLKVQMPSSTVARSVLQRAYRLKQTTGMENIFIRRSMPDHERKKFYALRKKAADLNALPDTQSKCDRYVVVNERLVVFRNCTRDVNARFVNGTLATVSYDCICDESGNFSVNLN